jgi:hypothetical protein
VIDISLAFSKDVRYPDARTMQADVRALSLGKPPAFARARRARDHQPTGLYGGQVVTEPMPASVRPQGVAITEPMPVSSRRLPATLPLRVVAESKPPSAIEPKPPATRPSRRLLWIAGAMLLLGALIGGFAASLQGSRALQQLWGFVQGR